jgi:hypothetical protein
VIGMSHQPWTLYSLNHIVASSRTLWQGNLNWFVGYVTKIYMSTYGYVTTMICYLIAVCHFVCVCVCYWQ